MKICICTLSFSVLLLSPLTICADAHGGIHIHMPVCEEEVSDTTPAVCLELKPWYQRQHFDDYEDIEEQSERLEDDTAWPGQREEFSDRLLR